jgi:hypothetical protein
LTVSASKLNLSQISFSSLGAAILNSPTYVPSQNNILKGSMAQAQNKNQKNPTH